MNKIENDISHLEGPIGSLWARPNGPGGPKKAPKMAVFGHIWPYLPIGGPSYLKLVGHCLNKVKHCIPYLGGAGWTPLDTSKIAPWGKGRPL